MKKTIKVNKKFSGKYYISGVVVEFKDDPSREDVIFVEYPEQLVSYEQIINFINRFYIAEAKPIVEEVAEEAYKESVETESTEVQKESVVEMKQESEPEPQEKLDEDGTTLDGEPPQPTDQEEQTKVSTRKRKSKKS